MAVAWWRSAVAAVVDAAAAVPRCRTVAARPRVAAWACRRADVAVDSVARMRVRHMVRGESLQRRAAERSLRMGRQSLRRQASAARAFFSLRRTGSSGFSELTSLGADEQWWSLHQPTTFRSRVQRQSLHHDASFSAYVQRRPLYDDAPSSPAYNGSRFTTRPGTPTYNGSRFVAAPGGRYGYYHRWHSTARRATTATSIAGFMAFPTAAVHVIGWAEISTAFTGRARTTARGSFGSSVLLPAYYSTFYWGGIPYYYWDDTYYTWSQPDYGYVATDPPPVVNDDDSSDSGSAETQSGDASSLYHLPEERAVRGADLERPVRVPSVGGEPDGLRPDERRESICRGFRTG